MSKHEPLSAQWLRKYRQGELSQDERVRLEALRAQDPFVADALEGVERLTAERYADDVTALRTRLAQRQSKPNRLAAGWWAVAASLVVLCVASFLLYTFLGDPTAERSSSTAVLEDSTEALAFRPEATPDDHNSKSSRSAQKAVSSSKEPAKAKDETTVATPDLASNGEESSQTVTYAKEERASQDFAIEVPQESEAEQSAAPQTNSHNQNESVSQAKGEGKVAAANESSPVTTVRKSALDKESPAGDDRGAADLPQLTPRGATSGDMNPPPGSSRRGADRPGTAGTRNRTIDDHQPTLAEVPKSGNLSPESTLDVMPPKVTSGQVLDEETNEPLPGVNVLILGTSRGTVTDIDGRFSLALPTEADSLTFNAVGYTAKKVASLAGDASYVRLIPDIQALSEVVVVGYGQSNVSSSENGFKEAQPIGGLRSFRRYLRDSLRYPADWKGKTVIVRVRFEVGADGTLRNFSILRSGGAWFDQEAIRVVKKGPIWTAAVRGGENVAQLRLVKIKFKAR